MGHHMMDTREGNIRPLGSPAHHPSGMMGHQPKHGWGMASPQIKGTEGSTQGIENPQDDSPSGSVERQDPKGDQGGGNEPVRGSLRE